MVDGNIEITLSLRQVVKDLADAAGTPETVHYDEMTKTYFINEVTEDILKDNGFVFLEESFNGTPIYKREDIYASYNSDPAYGSTMVYKTESKRLTYEEE